MIKVVVNGTFDILHAGHVEIIEYAKTLGNYLVVAIDTDRRIKELKGQDRPIISQRDRKKILESIRWVNDVQLFDSDSELIEIIKKCDIMVKGSDYRNKTIIGEELIRVIFYDRTEHSTTKIIQDIIDRG
jgi:D-beta-D-heptose 7-phosphate kinase/D-beta-D-heptose 1-phosphate adenosyltransferase